MVFDIDKWTSSRSAFVTTAWLRFMVCAALSLWNSSLAFPLIFDILPPLRHHMCSCWSGAEKVARSHIQVWHIEGWKSARGALVGKDSDIRTQFLSLSDTHAHTTLGQQHRWVLGKQAAAGGGKDHKAGWLAKFHHLLWIACDAHSTATEGILDSHAIANLRAHSWAFTWILRYNRSPIHQPARAWKRQSQLTFY